MEFQSESLLVNGIRLHCYRASADLPALVLVHGVTDDGLCWAPVAEMFHQKFDLTLVDLRGHGKSEAPVDGYTLENLGRDLGGLIQGLGLRRPVVLGHSLGAVAALVMAGLFPDLPRAILLEDPPPFWLQPPVGKRDPELRDAMKDWIGVLKRKTWNELRADCESENPGWSEAERMMWIDSKHRVSPLAIEFFAPEDLFTINFPALLRRITCPALLISGDPRQRIATSEIGTTTLKEAVPHLQFIQIDGAGHSIHRDQFRSYIEAVSAYLDGLEGA